MAQHRYKQIKTDDAGALDAMLPGTFVFRYSHFVEKKKTSVNIPSICIVKPIHPSEQDQFIVIQVKSTGNAASAIRRRKKEAETFMRLKERYGKNVKFILLLCGHFDPFYLGHQAAEGLDWVWEHRLDDIGRPAKGKKYRLG